MSSSRKHLFLSLFFISGASGLIYEIVWSRMLVFVFGGTTYAITTVLACFMGGLALGSFAGGRLSTRLQRPERLYGIFEILIGLYCLTIPYLMTLAVPLYRFLVGTFGESFSLLTVARVSVSSAILILPTTLMGATLPVLAGAFIHRTDELGGDTGRLYGFNTIGAFTGCALAGFFLLPAIGLSFSIYVAASLNLLAGTAAVLISERRPLAVDSTVAEEPPALTAEHETPMNKTLLLTLYGLSGFSAMAYQIAWTRSLIMSMGSSVYAFSTIVACFILGLAVGSLAISYWADRIRRPFVVAGVLEVAIGLGALVVVPIFGEMPGMVHDISLSTGATFGDVLTIEILCVLGLLAVPTLCMGALLPLICRVYDPRPGEAGRNVGSVYASNTLGTILGAIAAGFVLIPNIHIGMQRTIISASALSGIIGSAFILWERRWKSPRVLAFLGALWMLGITVSAVTGPWSKEAMVSAPFLGLEKSEHSIMYYREGPDTTVAVTYNEGDRSLRVNGKTDASTGMVDVITQYLLSQIPLLLKPDARDVLVIGLGSGATAGTALAYPVERVDVAELSSAVIEASQYFTGINNGALTDPRVHIHRTDARNYLLLTDRKYDLIISEPSNPWMSGISNLFTKEFFELAKSRLRPGGMHGQWIHSYSMSKDDFASIVRTVSEVFPYTQLWELSFSDYILLGSDSPMVIDVEKLYLNFSREQVSEVMSRIFLNDPMQMANHYIADERRMARAISDNRVLTDDLPYLEFSAPRHLLNKELGIEILEFLYGFKGSPTLSGDPDSALNMEFLEGIERARKRRNQIYQAILNTREKDLEAFLEDLVNIARFGKNDVRTIDFLITTPPPPFNDRKRQELIHKAYMEIENEIPDMEEFMKVAKVQPHVLFWPFSKRSRPASGTSSLEREIEELRASGRTDKGLERAKEALKSNPANPAMLEVTGLLSLELEGAEAAVPYLLKALVMDPRNPEVNYGLARAYALRGEKTRSLAFLKKAVREGLDDYGKIRSDPMLEGLAGDERFEGLVKRAE